MRFLHKSLILISVALILSPFSFAATFKLTHIGNIAVEDPLPNEIWYSGVNPVFKGVGDPNTTVIVKAVPSTPETFTATSDATGAWSVATSLAKGDYTITILNGTVTASTFTLHTGSTKDVNASATNTSTTPTSNTSDSATTQDAPVPDTGAEQVVALSFSAGVILLAIYFYIWGASGYRALTQKNYLKED